MSTESKLKSTQASEIGSLVVIRGIPGAGKSWLAEQLQRVVGERAVHIDLDDYRYKRNGKSLPFKPQND